MKLFRFSPSCGLALAVSALACSRPAPPLVPPRQALRAIASANENAPAPTCRDGDFVGCKKACDAGVDHGVACLKAGQVLLAGGWGQRARGDEGLAELVVGCDQGSRDACSLAADQYSSGHDAPRDPVRAFELAKRACDEGKDAIHCALLGVFFAEGVGTRRDIEHGFALQQKACDAGRAPSCFWLADAIEHGRRGAPDLHDAVGRYRSACDRGSSDACARLAALHRTGRGVPLDLDRAIELYEKACEQGSIVACTFPSGTSTNPKIVAARARGTEALGSSCKHGDPDACEYWEWTTLPVPERDVVVATMLGKACEQGSESACARLGGFYLDGRGVEKNTAEGRRRLRRGCALHLVGACSHLAHQLHVEPQGPEDLAEAMKLYTTECDSGLMPACNSLGYLYAQGVGAPVDGVRARQLFVKACDDADANACDSLAEAIEKGWGGPRDLEKARAQYARACDMAMSSSCDAAKRLAGKH